MTIFPQEKSLAKLLENDRTKSLAANISITEEKLDTLQESLKILSKEGKSDKIIAALDDMCEKEHPDLMYGEAILVSTVMNLNDDVFIAEEVIKAKDTPINTPYNDQHVECDIIGHIISAKCKDEAGHVVANSSIPNYLDVEVGFVVYKSIFPKIAEEIIKGAQNNTKFVSMECIFKNFDYALFDSQGNCKIVKRDESTAFLTKYLRAYGGDGLYDNYRIGRVLRDFRFVGMGNVDVPANKKSKYIKVGNTEIGSIGKVVLHVAKGKVMKIETLEQANEELQKLIAKITELETQVQTASNQLKSANEQLSAEKIKSEGAENAVAEANKKIKELEDSQKSVADQLKAKSDELEAINRKSKVEQRFNHLKELGFKVDETKKDELADWGDAQFNSVVEFAKTLKSNVSDTDSAEKQLENVEEEKKEIDETAGDVETASEKLQKMADKLVAALRKNSKNSSEK